MPNVNYVGVSGKNGGQNAELEQAKIASLQIANEMARTKLQKLQGELVSKKLVSYLTAHALTKLREQVLTVPARVCGRLRTFGLSPDQLRAIRVDTGNAVHRFLDELSENMAKVIDSEEFLAEFEGEERNADGDDLAKTARELKHEAALTRRREKRHEKEARAAKGEA